MRDTSFAHLAASEVIEAYVLGALSEHEAAAVGTHVPSCPSCRAAAEAFVAVTAGLAESVPGRSPSPELRERILAAAAAERRRRLPRAIAAALVRPRAALALAFVAALVLGGLVVTRGQRELQALREERDRAVALSVGAAAERDEYRDIVGRMSQGGRWWYMAGTDDFAGSGGTLVAPRRDGRAFVLFHDLRPLAAPERYVIWLITHDGAWVRAADFGPSGQALERVDLALQIAEFAQCAVTIETSDTGGRAGPLVMQSRIFQP